jgi:hypothetical protein
LVAGGAGGGDVLYDVVDGGGSTVALLGRRSSEAARLLGIISPGGQIPVLLSVGASWSWALAAGDRRQYKLINCSTKCLSQRRQKQRCKNSKR